MKFNENGAQKMMKLDENGATASRYIFKYLPGLPEPIFDLKIDENHSLIQPKSMNNHIQNDKKSSPNRPKIVTSEVLGKIRW